MSEGRGCENRDGQRCGLPGSRRGGERLHGDGEVPFDFAAAEQLDGILSDEQRIIHAESLPFDIVINGYAKNATPIPTSPPMAAPTSTRAGRTPSEAMFTSSFAAQW